MAFSEEERKQRARDRARAWRLANPERARENSRRSNQRWRERNPEKVREAWRRSNQKRREADPDGLRERRHQRYLESREHEIAKARRWQAANPGRVRELAREWSRRKKQADPIGESERFKRMKMARLHGMHPEDWAALWDLQEGRCYLCDDDLGVLAARNVHVDHDHRCCPRETSCSYCRRGLACFRCNSLIGMASDDPDRLRRIADNLETALKAADARLAEKPEQQTLLLGVMR